MCLCVCVCLLELFFHFFAAPLVACTARISLLNLWFSKQTARGDGDGDGSDVAATWPAAIAIEVAAELHEYSGKLLNMIMATHTRTTTV